jgi:CRP-like cAMP-binding protein
MEIKGLVVAILAAGSLFGCAAMREAQMRNLKAEAETYCTTFGFTPGTLQFQQCTLLRAGQIEEQRAATSRAIGQALLLQSLQNRPVRNRSSTTHCYTMGSYLNCNTY